MLDVDHIKKPIHVFTDQAAKVTKRYRRKTVTNNIIYALGLEDGGLLDLINTYKINHASPTNKHIDLMVIPLQRQIIPEHVKSDAALNYIHTLQKYGLITPDQLSPTQTNPSDQLSAAGAYKSAEPPQRRLMKMFLRRFPTLGPRQN